MNGVLAAGLYDWLMFLHVLAAMIWVGGLVVLTALSGYILRSGDDTAIAGFSASLRRIGPLTLAPSTVAVLALGIGLVFDSSSAWRFSQAWIILALALFAAAFLIGGRVPEPRRLSHRASRRGRRRERSETSTATLGLGDAADSPPARCRHLGHGLQARPLNRQTA
jgi:Predicted membrane protein